MKNPKPKYVETIRDRYGRTHIYYRRRDRNLRIKLPGPIGSPEFWKAYSKAMSGEAASTVQIGASRLKAGTMGALIAEYYQSGKFTSLNEASRERYRRTLEAFRKDYGDDKVSDFTPRHIDAILGQVAERSTASAKKLKQQLGVLLHLAVKWGYIEDDPMRHVDAIRHKSTGYRPWTEDDIAKYRAHWAVGTRQRIAFEVLLFTGLRRSDACRLGPQHLRDGYFSIKAKKTGAELEIPLHPTLARHLEHATGNLVYCTTTTGKAWSEVGFTDMIRKAAIRAGLASDSSPHGLRKAACRRLAEAGCTSHEIMSITGHKNLAEVDGYTRDANRKRLAKGAMAAIEDTFAECS